MSGIAFRGVAADQDARFANKEKKMLQKMAKTFPPEYFVKADLTRVHWESIKPWISRRVTELLGGIEDDVLISYVEEQVIGKKEVDPRILQLNLTGFLENNAKTFCQELWNLLVSASQTPSGIPQSWLDAEAEERRKREDQRRRMQERMYSERSRHDDVDDDRHHRYRDDRRRSSDTRRYGDGDDDRRRGTRRGRSRSPEDRRTREGSRERYHRRRRSYSRSISRERKDDHRRHRRSRS